ncbi:MAG TPA: cadherin-like beta sandwich domain-containing protein, partial [Acholeplasmataceae bacterium]|nr:cadherin-like beta sandwich domain-containing protein [Acholeplasmataceae bacterium]
TVKLPDGSLVVLNPEFNKDILVYNIRIDDQHQSVTINATIPNEGSYFSGNKSSYSNLLTINSGEKKSQFITVTAEDGITQKIYQLNIQRANNNADLDYIVIDGTTHHLANFTNKILTLPNVPFSKKEFEIDIIKKDELAITSSNLSNGKWILNQSGNLEFEFTITAQDGVTKNDHKIKVLREIPRINADLLDLTITLSNGTTVNLTPIFNKNTLTYNLRIDDTYEYVDISASLENVGSYFTGNQTTFNQRVTLNSGDKKTQIIIVTAEDGVTVKQYQINIQRANNIATFDHVNIDGVSYSESDFTIGVLNLGSISFNKKIYEISILKSDEKSILTTTNLVNGEWVLTNSGDLEFIFTITAQDGLTKNTYKIKVNRAVPRTNANLSDLTVKLPDGSLVVLNPEFNKDILVYNIRIDDFNEYVDISASLTNEGSTFVGNKNQFTKQVNLSSGQKKTETITVTAEDGISQKSYQVNIHRANNITSFEHVTVDGNVYNYSEFTNKVLILPEIIFS